MLLRVWRSANTSVTTPTAPISDRPVQSMASGCAASEIGFAALVGHRHHAHAVAGFEPARFGSSRRGGNGRFSPGHRTGWSIKKFVRTARRYRTVQKRAGQQTLTATEPLPNDLAEVLAQIDTQNVH